MFKRLSLALALSVSAISMAHAAPTTYQVDPAHTDVIAQWNHFGFSNPTAHFGSISGSITYDPAAVSASSVEIEIPLSGLNSHVPAFDEHLRADDLFDVVRFPSASFVSTAVKEVSEGRMQVTGNLTIRDITHEVVLDVVLNGQGEHPMTGVPAIGFDATTTLKRSDFGLGLFAPAVSDEVKIHITTEAAVTVEG